MPAEFGSTVKKTWMRGMEAVGDAFDRLAASTRLKVAEMNLSNQRKEILDGFGLRAYQMWRNGAVLPPELDEMLRKVAELEQQLAEVRAERLQAGTQEGTEQAQETAAAAASTDAAPAEMPAEEAAAIADPEINETAEASGTEAAAETASDGENGDGQPS